jgi:hypothetical protein
LTRSSRRPHFKSLPVRAFPIIDARRPITGRGTRRPEVALKQAEIVLKFE